MPVSCWAAFRAMLATSSPESASCASAHSPLSSSSCSFYSAVCCSPAAPCYCGPCLERTRASRPSGRHAPHASTRQKQRHTGLSDVAGGECERTSEDGERRAMRHYRPLLVVSRHTRAAWRRVRRIAISSEEEVVGVQHQQAIRQRPDQFRLFRVH